MHKTQWLLAIVGIFILDSSLVIADPTIQERTTDTGAVFVRDYSIPELGEAWRDPSGMIWGDMLKKMDGSVQFINHQEASDYCRSIGAELPSKMDFVRLREYMGAGPADEAGYVAQILPNLA